MKPVFFKNANDFRKWLQKNHTTCLELWVGYYKMGSGKKNLRWSESVEVALCFGWIDGIRKSIDEHSYTNRFTPRKPTSVWSAVNIQKVELLKSQGLMQPAGLAIYEKRKEHKSKIYAYENEAIDFSPGFKKIFKANKIAWAYFQKLAPSYQKVSIRWVMQAKQETTREKRLASLIKDSANGTNPWKDNKYAKTKKNIF